MKIHLVSIILFFACTCVCQPLSLLKKIGEGTPNTQSGLSQIFNGDLLNDGNVYFLGSHDGFTRDLWRTDGTPGGTFKITGETSPSAWQTVRFTADGVFLHIGNNLAFYKAGMLPIRNLGAFENFSFLTPRKMDAGRYMFLTEKDDMAGLLITDMTGPGTSYLGDIGPYHSFMTMYAGPYGAVVYNTNSFVDYEPMMYDAEADSILEVREFLAPYKSVSSVKTVAMYDHYLFLEVNEGGTQRYVFDLRSHIFYPGQYFFGVIEYFYPYGDDLLIVSEREITRMDTTTFSFTEYTDSVFPLGTHLLAGDRIYYHGYSIGDTVYVFSLDLGPGKITRLPGGQIGKNYYSSRFTIHDDELYYLRDFGPTTFLTRYDFKDSVAVDIDSITVRNSGLVIQNALIKVNGELLVSKFSPEEWHELYFLDESTRTPEVRVQEIKIFPNPCIDWLTLTISELPQSFILISDALGRVVASPKMDGGRIDVSGLPAGMYFGIVIGGERRYVFRFQKVERNGG